MNTELRAFYVVVGLVLVIPAIGGVVGGYGGLDAMAVLFGEDRGIVVSPGLRNHLRAIAWMFAAFVPLVVWTLRSLVARAGAFRIVFVFATLAGFVRLTGRFVDGNPGAIATGLTAIELVLIPILLAWHTRLVRRARPAS